MLNKIAVLSDIHGNPPALRAVLEDVAREQCAQVYMLGDVINGIAPDTCADMLRASEHLVGVQGNAEAYLLTPDLDEFPWRSEPMYAELIPLLEWWRKRLSADNLKWLRRLPSTRRENGIYLVHDSPLDRWRAQADNSDGVNAKYRELLYHGKGLTLQTPADEFAKTFAWMETQNVAGVFCGHTHEPFCKWSGDKFICNVGSVGMPLDSDRRAAWVLFEPTKPRPTLTIRRVEYDMDTLMALFDATPDFPHFANADSKRAYIQMFRTAKHWKEYLKVK